MDIERHSVDVGSASKLSSVSGDSSMGWDTGSIFSWLYKRYEGRKNPYPFDMMYIPGVSELEKIFIQYEDNIYNTLVLGGWWLLFIPLGIIYVLAAFAGQSLMKNRQPFSLRGQLIAWNAFLAIFSIIGTMRLFPESLDMYKRSGFYGTACDPRYMSGDGILWAWLFVFSKVIEMGDTAFIVLRKQKLIFLHWYHHVITFWFCLLCYLDQTSIGRWFMVMNYFVHSVMYSYYALKAAKVPVPKKISMAITSVQLSQMLVGFSVSTSALYWKKNGVRCDASLTSLYSSLVMYFSYVLLFAHFFFMAYRSYLVRFWAKYVTGKQKSVESKKGNGVVVHEESNGNLDYHMKNGVSTRNGVIRRKMEMNGGSQHH